jgi:hypothetical protein
MVPVERHPMREMLRTGKKNQIMPSGMARSSLFSRHAVFFPPQYLISHASNKKHW